MAAENAYKYDYGYAAAPAQPLEKKQQKQPELQRLTKVQPNAKLLEKQANKQLLKIAAAFAGVILMFGLVCNSFCARDDAKRRLDAANEALVICQAENKELNAKLTALKSVENIDKFAVEKLGLVKVTPENEIYLNAGGGNQVVLSQSNN